MYTRSALRVSSDLPRGWKKISVNLLDCEVRADLYISPEGKKFKDLDSARLWIARSIERSCNSEIIESPRRFKMRIKEEQISLESKYSPEVVLRRRRGRREQKNLLQTALKRKIKSRLSGKQAFKQSSQPSPTILKSNLRITKRINKRMVARIKTTRRV